MNRYFIITVAALAVGLTFLAPVKSRGQCATGAEPLALNFAYNPGTTEQSVFFWTNDELCQNTDVQPSASWIHVRTEQYGEYVYVRCDANTGAARSGYFYIDGSIQVAVQQAASPTPVPAMPGPITGNTTACRSSSQPYSISPVQHATSYVWSVTGGSITSGQGTANVTVLVGTGSSANVVVYASNAAGNSASRSVTASLYASPPVSSGPQSQTVCHGATVSFSVSASLVSGYQWQYSTNGGSSWQNISGATAASYAVTANHAVNNGYRYRCLVTGCGQTTTSGVAILTVNAAPVMQVTITGKAHLCGAEQGHYTASVQNAGSDPTYTWYKNGQVQGLGANESPVPYEYLPVTPLATDDQLRCVVNAFNGSCPGAATSNVLSIIREPFLVPPITVISTVPKNTDNVSISICGGQPVTFTASHGPVISFPVFQWKKNGVAIANATGSTYTSSALAENDLITVQLTSSSQGCIAFPVSAQDAIRVHLKPTPPDPVAAYTNVAYECNSATLRGISSGTCYWQSSISGTSTSYPLPYDYFVVTGGTYYIKALNAQGCWSIGGTSVTVESLDLASVSPQTTARSIIGTGTVNYQVVNATGTLKYYWYNADNFMVGTGKVLSRTLKEGTSETLYARAGRDEACLSPSPGTATTVYAYASPRVVSSPEFLTTGTVVLSANRVYDSYQWRYENNDITGATGATYTTGVTGRYSVRVTLNNVLNPATSPNKRLDDPIRSQDNLNYIIERTIGKEHVHDKEAEEAMYPQNIQEVVAYFDGFGRKIQTVNTQHSPSGLDVVQPVVYDAFGREAEKYLPWASTEANGRYKTNATGAGTYNGSAHYNFYHNGVSDKVADDNRPYAKTDFEASPLNRALKEFGPGESWFVNNKPIANGYLVNTYGTGNTGAQEKIIAWYVDDAAVPSRRTPVTGFIETGGYYSTAQLFIKSIKDEQGNETREYTDKAGRMILKKVQAVDNPVLSNRDHWTQTYYVYDEPGNLRFVFQPELSRAIHQNDTYNPTASDLDRLAFQYRYDGLRRMTDKKVPGSDWVYMVYDARDRLALTQEPNQRSGSNKNWSFTKYDAFSRPVLTGIFTADSVLTQSKMQRRVDVYYANLTGNGGAWYEVYNGTTAGSVHAYTNKSYPQVPDVNSYLTVTYYDAYDFTSVWGAGYTYVNDNLNQRAGDVVYHQPAEEFRTVTGQVTGTKVKVLDGGVTGGFTWLQSVRYYDDKYRLIQVIADNHKGGKDRISHVVDFTGKVLKTKTNHNEYDIQWKDITGATAAGSRLTRTASGSSWGVSGAASVQSLPAGQDGWAEVLVAAETVRWMFGLSDQNTNADFTSMDYAMDLRPDKKLFIYEYGISKTEIAGGYKTGDILRIQRNGTAVKYFRNGTEVYPAGASVTQTPSNTLLMVDVSIFSAGGVVTNIRSSFSSGGQSFVKRFSYDPADRLTNICHMTGDPVTWTSLTGASATGDQLTKTGTTTGWNAGAFSQQNIPANTDGWVEYKVTETTTGKMLGFSDVNTNVNYATIDYALYTAAAGKIYVYENGTNQGQKSTYTANDVFRVERKAGVVYYKKNNSIIYTSAVSATGALYADCSLNNTGATFTNVQMGTGTGGEIEIVRQEYNALGQLVDKKLHSVSGSAFRQSVDYRYNIRGWLASVNDAALTQDGTDAKDFFGMELGYNAGIGVGNAFYYNGNISAIKWSNNLGLGDTKEKAYLYGYDPLSRISGAVFKEKASAWNPAAHKGFSEKTYKYDHNGNILSLNRYDERGYTLQMDSLTYNYGTAATYSNRLLKVADLGDKFKGFVDGANSVNEYTYDANGNMTTDQNKGITAITYNFLNLPELITKGGNTVRYIYDATGRKLSQVTTFSGVQKQTDYAGEFTYENDALQFIGHEEGRMVMSTEKLISAHDGSTTADLTATGATLATATQNGGQTYILVTSGGTALRTGVFAAPIQVLPGERYRIRVKGYRTGADAAYISVKAGGADLGWPGAALPGITAAAEAWTEQTVTIPPGADQLEAGVAWNTVTAGQQFFLDAFEIIRLGTNGAAEYQYHLNDHLGNVRLTFTTRQEQDVYTATLEDNTLETEQPAFKNYSRITSDLFDHTDASTVYDKAQVLNGGNNAQVGLAKSFSVVPGDTIRAEVYAKYLGTTGGSGNLTGFATALLSAFGLPAPAAGETGTASSGINTYGSIIAGGGNSGNPAWPKGWLNILVFDKDHNLTDLAFQQLDGAYVQSGATKMPHQLLSREVYIKEPGYVYIYVSNEGSVQQEVYFDDLKITHKKSPVIQSDDYYPFGLAFNAFARESTIENKHLYNNGSERSDALDLNIDATKFRMYDPAAGRWWQVDPLADEDDLVTLTPYNYSYNNPVRYNDPEGDCPGCRPRPVMRYQATPAYRNVVHRQLIRTSYEYQNRQLRQGSREPIEVGSADEPRTKLGGLARGFTEVAGDYMDLKDKLNVTVERHEIININAAGGESSEGTKFFFSGPDAGKLEAMENAYQGKVDAAFSQKFAAFASGKLGKDFNSLSPEAQAQFMSDNAPAAALIRSVVSVQMGMSPKEQAVRNVMELIKNGFAVPKVEVKQLPILRQGNFSN